jgi:hypothetical protein
LLFFSLFLRKIDRYALWSVDDAYSSVGCGICSLLARHYYCGRLGIVAVHPLENVAFLRPFFLCSQFHRSITLAAHCLFSGVR